MSLSLIKIDTTNNERKRPRFRVDFVIRLSYLAAWPSLETRPLQVFIHFLFFFCPTDRPTIGRDGAMGNGTFYWDGPRPMEFISTSGGDAAAGVDSTEIGI